MNNIQPTHTTNDAMTSRETNTAPRAEKLVILRPSTPMDHNTFDAMRETTYQSVPHATTEGISHSDAAPTDNRKLDVEVTIPDITTSTDRVPSPRVRTHKFSARLFYETSNWHLWARTNPNDASDPSRKNADHDAWAGHLTGLIKRTRPRQLHVSSTSVLAQRHVNLPDLFAAIVENVDQVVIGTAAFDLRGPDQAAVHLHRQMFSRAAANERETIARRLSTGRAQHAQRTH